MERRRLREALPEGEARWAAVRLGKAPGGAPRGPATDLIFIGCPAARTTGGSAGRPAPRPRSPQPTPPLRGGDRGPFVSAPPRAASHSETGAAGSGGAAAEEQNGFPGGRGLAGARAWGFSPCPCREERGSPAPAALSHPARREAAVSVSRWAEPGGAGLWHAAGVTVSCPPWAGES